MNRTFLRYAIIVLTLITAVVHLYLGGSSMSNPSMSPLNVLWLLNGLGYLGLLGALFLNIPFLAEQKTMVHYVFMLFTAATIIAWVVMGDMADRLAYVTKVDEVLLIAALFFHQRAAEPSPTLAAAKAATKPLAQSKASSATKPAATTSRPASGKAGAKKKPASKKPTRSR